MDKEKKLQEEIAKVQAEGREMQVQLQEAQKELADCKVEAAQEGQGGQPVAILPQQWDMVSQVLQSMGIEPQKFQDAAAKLTATVSTVAAEAPVGTQNFIATGRTPFAATCQEPPKEVEAAVADLKVELQTKQQELAGLTAAGEDADPEQVGRVKAEIEEAEGRLQQAQEKLQHFGKGRTVKERQGPY